MKRIFIWTVACYLAGCSQETFNPADNDPLGFSFYPLEEGSYWVYQVQETFYHLDGTIDEESYELRYKINEQEVKDGKTVYNLQVKKRQSPEEPWTDHQLFQTWSNEKTAVLNTGSESVIKLSFPVEDNHSWNANSLNNGPEDIYTIDSAYSSFTFKDHVFLNTVTIVQDFSVDPLQITSDNVALEVYAKGVGLVYREMREISYMSCSSLYPQCCDVNNNEACFGEIDEGTVYRQWLTEYGNE